jgi:hypothetical protein
VKRRTCCVGKWLKCWRTVLLDQLRHGGNQVPFSWTHERKFNIYSTNDDMLIKNPSIFICKLAFYWLLCIQNPEIPQKYPRVMTANLTFSNYFEALPRKLHSSLSISILPISISTFSELFVVRGRSRFSRSIKSWN